MILGPTGLNDQETALGKLHHSQRTAQTADLNTLSLSDKEAYLLVQEHGGLGRDSQGTKASRHHLCALPLPPYSSPVPLRKALTYSSGAPVFVTPARPDYLALVTSGAGACGPTRVHTFALFKSCCLKVWLPNQLESGC